MECKKFYLKNNNKLQFIVMIINVNINRREVYLCLMF